MKSEIEIHNLSESICHSYADRNGVSKKKQLHQLGYLSQIASTSGKFQLADELVFLANFVGRS